MTDQKEFDALLRNPYVALARATIDLYVREKKVIDVPEDLPEELVSSKAGAFVTIHKGGDLRGCIGTIVPTRPTLAEEIIGNAILAATEDPRFFPVREEELSELDISVDVLGLSLIHISCLHSGQKTVCLFIVITPLSCFSPLIGKDNQSVCCAHETK